MTQRLFKPQLTKMVWLLKKEVSKETRGHLSFASVRYPVSKSVNYKLTRYNKFIRGKNEL